MVLKHEEKINSSIEGTIIDIETVGNFNREYKDSRQYMSIVPVIFGYIDSESLQIHCAKKLDSLKQLNKIIDDELSSLDKPFYAFNSDFERGVFFHSLKKEVSFERELNKEKFEAKRDAVWILNIPQYDDPYKDVGKLCSEAWQCGNINNAIAHNRSCLLKERDIFLKRGFRIPDPLRLTRE
jgi:hypothetical protein